MAVGHRFRSNAFLSQAGHQPDARPRASAGPPGCRGSRRAGPDRRQEESPGSDKHVGPAHHSSVTQPSEADFTVLMYLYNVPRVAL